MDIIVGTAGHIDHGKTALVRALTGIDTDRLEEEKRRGISIDIGFAHLNLAPDLRDAAQRRIEALDARQEVARKGRYVVRPVAQRG